MTAESAPAPERAAAPGPPRAGALRLSLSALLALFVAVEVNAPQLQTASQLALFAWFGLMLCLLPKRGERRTPLLRLGWGLVAAVVTATCGWVLVQSEPVFRRWWVDGSSLGARAGAEATVDVWIGVLGLLVVLVCTARVVGWALPILSTVFLVYAFIGPYLPDWLLPHRGYSLERVVAQTFLHSQGVFGVALKVMFAYVFLFVLFGALLEATGATGFIVNAARRIFRRSQGGAAKVAVLSSGLMGSLSGSAVANTATTGTFTIPMMRSSGFRRETAAGVEAAASSGGALVPPVMGAGAYMMLEIVTPPVTYGEIIRAAMIPALLYYLSLFLLVHFRAKRIGARDLDSGAGDASGGPGGREEDEELEREMPPSSGPWGGFLFASSLLLLVVTIVSGFTVFRAVSVSLVYLAILSLVSASTRVGWSGWKRVLVQTGRAAAPLVAAASCVGIVIGVVTLTGVGTRLPSLILPLAEQNLLAALALIMVSTIILGMGLPSAVCYLLMATLIGPVLGQLGVVPLAAHLFIFYFGMMSMVTPPVALAAYAAASIAGSDIMRSGFAAFRFALVGFTLPYMFVQRPELLLLAADGGAPRPARVAAALAVAVLGIVALAAALAGFLGRSLGAGRRWGLGLAAALLLWPEGPKLVPALGLTWLDLVGVALLGAISVPALRRG